jgi:hypothetical protein
LPLSIFKLIEFINFNLDDNLSDLWDNNEENSFSSAIVDLNDNLFPNLEKVKEIFNNMK